MLDKTSIIICAFGLASAAPRSPYRHLELCGIALILFAPDSFRNLFNQLELVPLLQPGQLVADLAGDKTTLRAQAEAVHFSASWMRAITVSLYTEEKAFTQEHVQQLFLYIEGMPEDEKNVPFYEKHGFQRMKHGAAIQICNYSDKR